MVGQTNINIGKVSELAKNQIKSYYVKWTYGHSGNDYRVRVATFSKLYLTTTGITMQSL